MIDWGKVGTSQRMEGYHPFIRILIAPQTMNTNRTEYSIQNDFIIKTKLACEINCLIMLISKKERKRAQCNFLLQFWCFKDVLKKKYENREER